MFGDHGQEAISRVTYGSFGLFSVFTRGLYTTDACGAIQDTIRAMFSRYMFFVVFVKRTRRVYFQQRNTIRYIVGRGGLQGVFARRLSAYFGALGVHYIIGQDGITGALGTLGGIIVCWGTIIRGDATLCCSITSDDCFQGIICGLMFAFNGDFLGFIRDFNIVFRCGNLFGLFQFAIGLATSTESLVTCSFTSTFYGGALIIRVSGLVFGQ